MQDKLKNLRDPGWRSAESAQCGAGLITAESDMWVEFVVGSHPCSEGFSQSSPVSLPSQKPTFLNSNSIWNLSANSLSVKCHPPQTK